MLTVFLVIVIAILIAWIVLQTSYHNHTTKDLRNHALVLEDHLADALARDNVQAYLALEKGADEQQQAYENEYLQFWETLEAQQLKIQHAAVREFELLSAISMHNTNCPAPIEHPLLESFEG